MLGQQVCQVVLAGPELPCGSVGAINEDAEWLRLCARWTTNYLHENAWLIEPFGWNVVNVLRRNRGSLRNPVEEPAAVQAKGDAWTRCDKGAGEVDFPIELA